MTARKAVLNSIEIYLYDAYLQVQVPHKTQKKRQCYIPKKILYKQLDFYFSVPSQNKLFLTFFIY